MGTVARNWTRDTIAPADWTVTLPDTAVAELLAVRDEIRRAPVPIFLLDSKDFALDACRATMNEVRRRTQDGPMFAVLDRLPLAEVTRDEAIQLYWLISSLLARPVAQKITGQMFFDVTDTGAKLKPGSGIRPTVTNVDLRFHNDNSYNQTPPEYVCLLCLHPAKEGGISQVMSVATVHEALQERYPELMPRLYQPFWYDRHAEHHAGEPTTFAAPIFERGDDGAIKARLALGRSMPATSCAASGWTTKRPPRSRPCNRCSTGPSCMSSWVSHRGRSNTSTTGRRGTPAPSSSTSRSQSANAIW